MDNTHFRKLATISQDIQNAFLHCVSSAVQNYYLFCWSIWNWELVLHPDFKYSSYAMIFLSVLKVMLYLFKWIVMYQCSAVQKAHFWFLLLKLSTEPSMEYSTGAVFSIAEKQWTEEVLLCCASHSTCQMLIVVLMQKD